MFTKHITAVVLAATMLLSAQLKTVQGGHAIEGQVAEGIAALIFLKSVWKKAASSANADKDDENYSYSHGLGARDNAVAACVHRAFRSLQKAGGIYLRFDNVKGVGHLGKNDFEVVISVTEVHSSGHKKRTITCVVNHNLIKTFVSS